MPDSGPKTKRKLTVTSCTQKATGTSQKGNAWTLYDVAALDESGEPIEAALKSFEECPLGELLEYEVERQDSTKYGVSFLIKRVKERLGPRVEALEKGLADALARIERLESGSYGAMSAPAPGPRPGDEEDIPF